MGCSHLGFPGGSVGKRICLQCRRPGFNPWVTKIPLEKGMTTHSNIFAWRTPWTEEPGGLQSVGLQRAGLNWATNTFIFFLSLQSVGSKPRGLKVAVVHGLSCPSLMGSSWTRDWTHVLCVGRQILNHWTTREIWALCVLTSCLVMPMKLEDHWFRWTHQSEIWHQIIQKEH